MENKKVDLKQEAFDELMDNVFDLANELEEKDWDDLTETEAKFIEALDTWCDLIIVKI